MGIEFTFDAKDFLDLGDLNQQAAQEEDQQAVEDDQETTEDVMADLGLDDADEEEPAEDEEP